MRVWAYGENAAQIRALCALRARMTVQPDLVVIGDDCAREEAQAQAIDTTPPGFNLGQDPDLVLWMSADLTPSILSQAMQKQIPVIFLDAGAQGRFPSAGWRPGRLRWVLSRFQYIIATNGVMRDRLLRSGASPYRIAALGRFDDTPIPPACDETERGIMAEKIGSRPIWLAMGVPDEEIDLILTAYKNASRTAHRLLLIIVPRDPDSIVHLVKSLEAQHLAFSCRSDGADPEDWQQAYIADISGENGLWYQLSPVTYLGGSFSLGSCDDPFAPVTSGSVVIHGSVYGRYDRAFHRLMQAQASVSVQDATTLGQAVESLLAPDRVAEHAAAGWEVVTKGAEVTNKVIDVIQEIAGEGVT